MDCKSRTLQHRVLQMVLSAEVSHSLLLHVRSATMLQLQACLHLPI